MAVAVALGIAVALGLGLFFLSRATRRAQVAKLRQHGDVLRAALESAVTAPIEEADGAVRCVLTGGSAPVDLALDLRKDANWRYVGKGRGPLVVTCRMQVDVLGLGVPIRLRPRSALSALQKAVGLAEDAEVGDAAFDDAWIVECDPAVAKQVLTAEVRGRLAPLAKGLPVLSAIEVGPRGLSIEWQALTIGRHHPFRGLVGREPTWTTAGEPRAAVAYVQGALLALRASLLAHAEASGTASAGIFRDARVGAEPEPAVVDAERASSGPKSRA